MKLDSSAKVPENMHLAISHFLPPSSRLLSHPPALRRRLLLVAVHQDVRRRDVCEAVALGRWLSELASRIHCLRGQHDMVGAGDFELIIELQVIVQIWVPRSLFTHELLHLLRQRILIRLLRMLGVGVL